MVPSCQQISIMGLFSGWPNLPVEEVTGCRRSRLGVTPLGGLPLMPGEWLLPKGAPGSSRSPGHCTRPARLACGTQTVYTQPGWWTADQTSLPRHLWTIHLPLLEQPLVLGSCSPACRGVPPVLRTFPRQAGCSLVPPKATRVQDRKK